MGCRSVNDVRRSVEEGQLKLNSEAWKNSPWKNDSSEVEAVYNRNSQWVWSCFCLWMLLGTSWISFSSSFFQPWQACCFRTNSLASSSSKILPSASHEKRSPSWWTMCSVALGVALGHACDLAFVECWYNIPIPLRKGLKLGMILKYSQHSEGQHAPPIFTEQNPFETRLCGWSWSKNDRQVGTAGNEKSCFWIVNEWNDPSTVMVAGIFARTFQWIIFFGSICFVRPRYWRGPRRLCGILLDTKNVDQRECRTKG